MEYDLEMLQELGYCNGIENYSRYLSGRGPGEPPPCLLDYLPDNALMVMDESHVSVPQFGGMYKGDRSRKSTLVEYGFRLPSALDNRPLKFEEFATYLLTKCGIAVVPGTAFGLPGYMRISFANSKEKLADAAKRLKEILG